MDTLLHNIPPIFNKKSKVLILGSFPSVKSRRDKFFYAHPTNRFWRVLAKVCGFSIPITIADKKELIYSNNLALWDVLKSCSTQGSSDTKIKHAQPNDLNIVLNACRVNTIFLNGSTAGRYYTKYFRNSINLPAIILPSTSAANAAYSLENLVEKWSVIKEYI